MFRVISLVLAASIVSGCSAVSRLPVIGGLNDRVANAQQKSIEEEIAKNPKLVTLDSTCKQLGILEGMEFIEMNAVFREVPMIAYFFKSDADRHHVKIKFDRYLEARGWHSSEARSFNDTFAYQKEDLRIVVQVGGMRSADYGLTCMIIKEEDTE